MFLILWKKLKVFLRILKRRQEPTELAIELPLELLNLLGVWRGETTEDSAVYKFYNKTIIAVLFVFAFSITCDLYDAMYDFESLIDDMCVLLGVYLILFKIIKFQTLRHKIWYIIKIFQVRCQNIVTRESQRSKELYRKHFLEETALQFGTTLLGFSLFIAVNFQPIFSLSFVLPFRGKYPFSTAFGTAGYIVTYIFQTVCCMFIISDIVYMDSVSLIFISQTGLNLQILSDNLRKLGRTQRSKVNGQNELRDLIWEHQNILSLVHFINETQHSMFVAQVLSSTSIICLTAFEVTLTTQMSSLIKFASYMFAAFTQLYLWCYFGDRVTYQSLQVADGAYDCMWINSTGQLKNDIRFIIHQAQQPLVFKASPFYDFNYESFLKILSASYSYFTLLRTVNQGH